MAIAVHPAVRVPGKTAAASWITTHNGKPDYLMTAPNASTNDPDKQWITIDTNPASPHYGRIYAMWTLFVISPSIIYESHADARPDGTHTDWSAPQVLPTISGKRWDTYLLPQVTPDGTVWTTTTNNPQQQDYSHANIYLISSQDGGVTWQGPLPVAKDVNPPVYKNTTFRECIVNTFAVGSTKIGANYPLYVAYEDGASGLSNIYLKTSIDGGQSWSAPILVNDNESEPKPCSPISTWRRAAPWRSPSTTAASRVRRKAMLTPQARALPTIRGLRRLPARPGAVRTTASIRRCNSTSRT